jgi:hypothetical protein
VVGPNRQALAGANITDGAGKRRRDQNKHQEVKHSRRSLMKSPFSVRKMVRLS